VKLSRKKLNKLIKEELEKILIDQPADDLDQEDADALDFIVKHALNEATQKRNKKVKKFLKEVKEEQISKNYRVVVQAAAGLEAPVVNFDMDGVLVDFGDGVSNIAGSILNMKNLLIPDMQQQEKLLEPGTFQDQNYPVATRKGAFGVVGTKIFTKLVDLAGKFKHFISRGKYKDAAYHEDYITNSSAFTELIANLSKNPTFRQRFWQTLPPNPEGMKLYLNCLNSAYFEGVGILTSPLLNRILDTVEGKKRWIASYMATARPDFVIMDGNKQKYAIVNGQPSILIDDWSFNCDSFKQAGGRTILFRNGIATIY
tara:strand:- start:5740 stop:6681 length:942 start_codon:yes stop_codon:yes gene_type:complete